MGSDPAAIPAGVLRDVCAALGSAVGGSVAISSATAITEGWSARFGAYPWIARCAVDGPPRWGVTSVIVKTRRPDDHWRAGDTTSRERAALTFLDEIGADAGPRILAHDDALGFVVLEDLGCGSALEDLLVDDDPAAATAGFVALAEAVGRMHASTWGRQDVFHAHLRGAGVNPQRDRVSLANLPLSECWSTLRDLATGRDGLPDTTAAGRDLDDVLAWMAEPGPMLVLSNGDLAPQNCRLRGGSARLLDFEGAKFQHALLDAAHLRLPFYGGPCWSRIPAEVGELGEAAYRKEFAKACPSVLAEETYAAGIAAATAAWAVTRLVRLPKLLTGDEPHPMGFSRRGQLLDTIQVAVDASADAGTLRSLRAWFEEVIATLRRRWPHLPAAQQVYPAFRRTG
jgi:hypothetical protein